ncbi:MAG: GIY-YIG nuclease family protein, partial [Sedimentisphaerales bacterium]|nr:GIY-YIG nuclease family protein [Sedimentisphaerales bacterium]
MTDSDNIRLESIRNTIRQFPSKPGVYFMKDRAGLVLYIGKAANLRDRAGSYFQPSADLINSRGPKIVEMVSKVIEVNFLECDSEVDAILQEARLIKDIHPPYNTRQLDDKSFPYIEITSADDFPAVYLTRTPQKSSKLYGPFTSISEVRRVIQVLQRIFRFRT